MTDEDGKIASAVMYIMVLVRFDIYLVWGFETTVLSYVAAVLQYTEPS